MENKSSDKLSDICYIKGSRGRWECIMSHDHSISGRKQWGKHNIKLHTFLVLLQGCTGKVVYVSFWTLKLNIMFHKELTSALKQVKRIIEKWHVFEHEGGLFKKTSQQFKNFHSTFLWSNIKNHKRAPRHELPWLISPVRSRKHVSPVRDKKFFLYLSWKFPAWFGTVNLSRNTADWNIL